jgi:hypothetical protein
LAWEERKVTPTRNISVVDRIRSIWGPYEISDGDTFAYTWDHGYETLTVSHNDGGTLEFKGVYHPGDGSCDGDGICRWCGRTLHA